MPQQCGTPVSKKKKKKNEIVVVGLSCASFTHKGLHFVVVISKGKKIQLPQTKKATNTFFFAKSKEKKRNKNNASLETKPSGSQNLRRKIVNRHHR
jgi:hypothetical protein